MGIYLDLFDIFVRMIGRKNSKFFICSKVIKIDIFDISDYLRMLRNVFLLLRDAFRASKVEFGHFSEILIFQP